MHMSIDFTEAYCDLFTEAVRDGDTLDQQKLLAMASIQAGCSEASPPRIQRLGYLLLKLPPVIARKKAHEYLSGMVGKRALSQADYLGLGPRVSWRLGKHVCYPTAYLLEWIEETQTGRGASWPA
jgi:hypothetical protein